jgi:NTE family protein
MRSLILSGGGAKGSFQVGALRYLVGDLQVKYDIICGVSVGALNGSFLAQYKVGDEINAYKGLADLWAGIDTSKIYKQWWLFRELAALWKQSVYNSQPLIDLVRSKLDVNKVKTSGKKLRVGAVSLGTGEYRAFAEDYSDIAGAVLASSAFPAMLRPIDLEGQLWTDGGVKHITPVKAAIDCGADAMDIIVTSPDKAGPGIGEDSKTLTIVERSIDLMSDQILANDIKMAQLVNKLALSGQSDKRVIEINILRPDDFLTDNSLDFSPAKLQKMMNLGYCVAQRDYKRK